MSLDQFGPEQQLVTEIVATVLDVDADELNRDTPLAEIPGWDSVNALRVLAYLERRLGRSLDYDRFHDATTIGALAALVDDVVSAGGPVR